ncbi:MAG: rRNA maturation RNase YbeY [Butyrivibrio sp.]|jgi:probable rRNA maturation factor|nr:rRNA maturation RNase YbeY [Butyrivibrio sp.]
MIFFIENEVDAEFDFDPEEIARSVCEAVLQEESCPWDVEVNMIITDDNGIQEMNRQFREIDRPTDVLSFPNVEYPEPADFSALDGVQKNDCLDPDTGKIMLGDIVINEKRVREQALSYGHSQKREFAFLTAHSMLHLCGYDHMEPDEAKVMEDKQTLILDSLGITRDQD